MKYPHPFFLFWEILFWIFIIRICNHVIARNFLTAIILSRLYMYVYVQPKRINGNLGCHSWAREDEDWSRSIIVAVIRAWVATDARVLLNQWRVVTEPFSCSLALLPLHYLVSVFIRITLKRITAVVVWHPISGLWEELDRAPSFRSSSSPSIYSCCYCWVYRVAGRPGNSTTPSTVSVARQLSTLSPGMVDVRIFWLSCRMTYGWSLTSIHGWGLSLRMVWRLHV